MFWSWKSRKTGRTPSRPNLKELIREMARDNPTWGEERIADELNLKLGILVSPRTVRKYLRAERPGGGKSDQRWTTFVRNHAKSIVACDFLVSITATFQILYVFVAMEIGSRRILHLNVTSHPTAEWTTRQFREILADPHPYRFVVHESPWHGSEQRSPSAGLDFHRRADFSPRISLPSSAIFGCRV
jgi:hypothetical protein